LIKIATWNVNSIRARQEAVLSWLRKHAPDLLCLQETKVEDAQFPMEAFRAAGYEPVVAGQKSYNGVAMLSKRPLTEVRIGFADLPLDEQKRLMAATIDGIRVINVYMPNGQSVGSEKFIYKLGFIARLRTYLDQCHKPEEPLVLVGDFNVAPEPIDVHDPKGWEGEVLFHPEARAALAHLKSWGLEDLFRLHHTEGGAYSWWDYRIAAFRRNLGLRIDHLWGTSGVAARCRGCEIDKAPRAGERPSDHAPVIAVFE
jgi:exodeoxyribonuclease-3